MRIAGIIGHDENAITANLISSIFTALGTKVSVVDSRDLTGLDSGLVRSYISELEKNDVDILLLKIKILDVGSEILDSMHFDVIVCNNKADDVKDFEDDNYSNFMRRVFSLLDEKGTAIVNVDYGELSQLLEGIKRQVVTYGFNSRASITASSTGDTFSKDSFLCCLQKTISTKNGLLIEPQEFKINVGISEFDPYSVLAAATFAIISGVDLNDVDGRSLKF